MLLTLDLVTSAALQSNAFGFVYVLVTRTLEQCAVIEMYA